MLRFIQVIAFGISLASGVAAAQEMYPVEVADGIYSYGDPTGYFSMFVVTDDGVISIEPVNPIQSRGLLDAIKSVTDQPIKYLLHSHNHWDHSNGGQVFRDEGATIIAHVDAYNWMRDNPHPDLALPDESWGGPRKDIVLGDTTVEMHHFGTSHGFGMTVFVLPEQRFGYIADLVAPNRLPFMFLPDFSPKEMERTLEEILELDFDRAIFSHNANASPRQGGTMQDVADTLQYLRDLRAGIQELIDNGTDPRMAPTTVRLPDYENWVMYDEWLALNAWRIWLEGFMGPFPWKPD